uniref:Transmembrane protein 45B n=1 Tax=Crocodylus porosus TaxID=8502 RepID=A0A7M4E4I5_CROPO
MHKSYLVPRTECPLQLARCSGVSGVFRYLWQMEQRSIILIFACSFLHCSSHLVALAIQFVPDGLCVKLYNYKENHWDHLMNWQHVTMCLFYSISGLVDIVAHGTDAFPVAIGRMMLSLAVLVEVSSFITTNMEDIVTIRLRTSLCILQGSWLWQIVFVLYPPNGIPEGNQMDHNNMLFLTMCCCWHYAFAFLILAVNYTVWHHAVILTGASGST